MSEDVIDPGNGTGLPVTEIAAQEGYQTPGGCVWCQIAGYRPEAASAISRAATCCACGG